MLKGIKKSKPAAYEQTPKVNENKIKYDQIEEQRQDHNDMHHLIQREQEVNQLAIYQQCLHLYLQGEVEAVQSKLNFIKTDGQRKHLNKKHVHKLDKDEIKKSSKFEYEINFDDEEQQPNRKSKKRQRPIMASKRVQDYCIYCPDNQELTLISASNYVYLAFPKRKTFKKNFYFIIAPVDHEQTMIGLNEDILTQINNFKKCLIQAFDKINLHVVFFQQFSATNSHIFIQCLVMSINKGKDLPFFFKQALDGVEGNWNTHQNIIKIEKEKGGLQKQIPKQMKYFYIDFGLGYGYAHVIEDEKNWKRDFCYEVLATGLNLEYHTIKTTEQYEEQQLNQKKEEFRRLWDKYDWTKLI